MKRVALFVALTLLFSDCAFTQETEPTRDSRPGIAPDIRDDETNLKIQRGNFVVVPIPISDPTLDTGLVLGSAYFYPQTEEQKKRQPASVTALAGMYTSNDSRAIIVAQQNYWRDDKWRFTGVVGAADLRISLLAPEGSPSGASVDWRINGGFLFAKGARRLAGNWYGGLLLRLVDANQTIETNIPVPTFDTGSNVRAIGAGGHLEYDSRDMPLNSYSGRHFKIDGLFNDEAVGSDQTYQSYSAAFQSYHELTDSLVLAWEAQGCVRAGTPPLWDACTIKLRGFSMTDYMGKVSASSQAEIRWRLNDRWGLVGFGGAGYVGSSFNNIREREAIPSYGVGVRFMVLRAKRINLRIDFARSTDSDAIHVSVGEAF